MAASTGGPGGGGPGTALEAVRSLARAARLLERSSSELSMAHYRVLAAIAAGHARASRVAERLELGRPTVSASVDALCRGGLLVRAGARGDQRAVDLRLTPAGAAVLERVERKMVRRVEDLCTRTADPGHALAALASLGEALDQVQAERLDHHRHPPR